LIESGRPVNAESNIWSHQAKLRETNIGGRTGRPARIS
jgi:hypothetical protein